LNKLWMKAWSLGSSRFFFVSYTVRSLLKFILGSKEDIKGCACARAATVGCLQVSPSQNSVQVAALQGW
jgi:hypothetical protein